MSYSNLHNAKDNMIHKLIDFLHAWKQINLHMLTPANQAKRLDSAVKPFVLNKTEESNVVSKDTNFEKDCIDKSTTLRNDYRSMVLEGMHKSIEQNDALQDY